MEFPNSEVSSSKMVSNYLRFLLLICCAFLFVLVKFTNDNNNIRNNIVIIEQQKKKMIRKNFEIRFLNFKLNYRMEFKNRCPPKPKLIMLSMSRRDGFGKRSGIRSTWLKDAMPGQMLRFLIADGPSKGEAKEVKRKLKEEQRKHGDLVFLHGFIDTYAHIHLKWYGGIQWQQSFCADAEWVMKADDDAVIHLQRLAYWTEKKFRTITEQNPLVYFGHVYYLKGPIRDPNSKWYLSKDIYPGDKFPNFLQGTVYLATSTTINATLSHSHEIEGFYLDDVVFTGLLAKLANVSLSDQKWHFVWGTTFKKENSECIDGVPTAFSMWGAETLSDYEHLYEKLKNVKCK